MRTVDKLAKLKADYQLTEPDLESIDSLKQRLTLESLGQLSANHLAIQGMATLKNRGYQLALCSNSRRVYVDQIITALGISSLLDLTVCGNEVQYPKPNPEIFITAMRHFNVEPQQTLIFEDSQVGLQAAKASGANVVEVDPQKLITKEQFTL